MMMKHPLGALVSGLLIAAALSLASGANAQAPAPKAESPKPAMMAEHHTDKGVWVEHGTDMMKECRTMMAKHQEMQGKLQVGDRLDGIGGL